MPYTLFKFMHVGSMFMATALAIGPAVLLYLISRTGNLETIRRAFAHAPAVFRVGAAFYGLGLIFGFVTAVNGSISLATPWLMTAYVLVLLLIGVNFTFERWTHRVERAVDSGDERRITASIRSWTPVYGLLGMAAVTLTLVFVMVVKPAF